MNIDVRQKVKRSWRGWLRLKEGGGEARFNGQISWGTNHVGAFYLGHYLGTKEVFRLGERRPKIVLGTLMEKIWCELCWKVCSSGRKTFFIWLPLLSGSGENAANLLIVVVILAIKIIHNMWREILAWWTKFSTPNHHFCSFFVLSQNRDTRYHHNKTLFVSFASFIAFARTSFVCKYFHQSRKTFTKTVLCASTEPFRSTAKMQMNFEAILVWSNPL